jgi:glutaredoxin 3
MAKVEIYTSANCSYCIRAKKLLEQKGIKYIEIPVDQDNSKRDEMLKRSGGKRTMPQIFINDRSIGGYDDLWALEQKKELDQLLKS